MSIAQYAQPKLNKVWIKPLLSCWKINWDAAIANDSKKTGVGVVIRDDVGGIVAVKSKLIPYIMSPIMLKQ